MINLARWIDRYVGDLLAFLLGFFVWRTLPPTNPRRILVIRLWTLGESLLALPMIERLHRAFPQAHLDVLATMRSLPVVQGHAFIHSIRLLNVRSLVRIFLDFHHYDLVIDSEPYFRLSALLAFWLGKTRIGFGHGLRSRLYNEHAMFMPDQHAVYSFSNLLKPLGITHRPSRLIPLLFRPEDRVSLHEKLSNAGLHKPLIAMHTGTAEAVPERAWPAAHFAELINRLVSSDRAYTVLLTGKGAYDDRCNRAVLDRLGPSKRVVNFANRLSFGEFCALMTEVDFFVANDSGPMHLAAAMGARTVGLFGPEAPYRYGPFPLHKNLSFYNNGDIGPCIRPWLGKPLDCSRQVAALRSITAEEVYEGMRR